MSYNHISPKIFGEIVALLSLFSIATTAMHHDNSSNDEDTAITSGMKTSMATAPKWQVF